MDNNKHTEQFNNGMNSDFPQTTDFFDNGFFGQNKQYLHINPDPLYQNNLNTFNPNLFITNKENISILNTTGINKPTPIIGTNPFLSTVSKYYEAAQYGILLRKKNTGMNSYDLFNSYFSIKCDNCQKKDLIIYVYYESVHLCLACTEMLIDSPVDKLG